MASAFARLAAMRLASSLRASRTFRICAAGIAATADGCRCSVPARCAGTAGAAAAAHWTPASCKCIKTQTSMLLCSFEAYTMMLSL